MKLSYELFDQTDQSGFRVLAAQGCNSEAADLISEYIKATGSTRSSLRWHIAQLRATAGDYPTAIEFAKLSLSPAEDFSLNALRWNDYVLATIGYLERDKNGLLAHRANVEAARTLHFGNELNLKLLNALVEHYDRDYKYATSHISD
ncbi:hypothetical protein OPU71_20940 [Niveibacterium sp. 24ML]|uniref:hypothetical protein n=1 Tax=Niveibacterium sp. 24ML TaxID=2985512 RepID=UPI002270FEAA|nr:hypothetical protein [Niveibacterium sp. 24ML]MCX9158587.1 hypothetical protein [Niveibacterium sp. 24ML]